MGLDDLSPDDSKEPKTYQAGQEYPVEFTGHCVTPVFEITPAVPEQYTKEHGDYKKATRAWVEDEDPLMEPEFFRSFFHERSKSVFSGETQLRSQAVVKGVNVHDEWEKDSDDVELGFEFLVALYYNDTHYYDGDESFRRAESMMGSDLERWVEQVEKVFKDTPYVVPQYTLIPHKAGTKPLDKDYERY
jgi:hypothetical protein